MKSEICFILTGATGLLGSAMLKELICALEEKQKITATFHNQIPGNFHIDERVTWIKFDLSNPKEFLSLIPREKKYFVFHFACTVSENLSKVFRLDCKGTELLASELANIGEVIFIYASSIDANTDSNYGLGKHFVEQRISLIKSKTFYPISVRIPAIANSRGDHRAISIHEFGGYFLNLIKFETLLKKLKCGEVGAYKEARELPDIMDFN